MKPKVLVTEPIHQVGWNLLAAETEAVAWVGPQAEPLAQALEEAQGVIVRSARLPGDIIRGAKGISGSDIDIFINSQKQITNV